MNTINALERLCTWYADYCDGEWEHLHGINIHTVDNPGWVMEIDLGGTPFEHLCIEKRITETNANDWTYIEVKEGRFIGAGSPMNLEYLIDEFFKLVNVNIDG